MAPGEFTAQIVCVNGRLPLLKERPYSAGSGQRGEKTFAIVD